MTAPRHVFGWLTHIGTEQWRSSCLTCGWLSPWVHDRRTAHQAWDSHAAAKDPS